MPSSKPPRRWPPPRRRTAPEAADEAGDAAHSLHRSPFYRLLEGARQAVLEFPVHDDEGGPFWDAAGRLDRERCPVNEQELVEVVALGAGRFRLTGREAGPFSMLRLYWGDVFDADELADGTLRLTAVTMPRPFAHARALCPPGFGNDHPLARLAHELGGGWETVAFGFLTVTVPSGQAGEFERRVAEGRLWSGLTIET